MIEIRQEWMCRLEASPKQCIQHICNFQHSAVENPAYRREWNRVDASDTLWWIDFEICRLLSLVSNAGQIESTTWWIYFTASHTTSHPCLEIGIILASSSFSAEYFLMHFNERPVRIAFQRQSIAINDFNFMRHVIRMISQTTQFFQLEKKSRSFNWLIIIIFCCNYLMFESYS